MPPPSPNAPTPPDLPHDFPLVFACGSRRLARSPIRASFSELVYVQGPAVLHPGVSPSLSLLQIYQDTGGLVPTSTPVLQAQLHLTMGYVFL